MQQPFLAEMDDDEPLQVLEMKATSVWRLYLRIFPWQIFGVANWEAIHTLLTPPYKTYYLLQLRISARPASRSWYK